jgi:hypothetical protein
VGSAVDCCPRPGARKAGAREDCEEEVVSYATKEAALQELGARSVNCKPHRKVKTGPRFGQRSHHLKDRVLGICLCERLALLGFALMISSS